MSEPRVCDRCGRASDSSDVYGGPDACLGRLPGVRFACCGHGDRTLAYLSFEDGTVVRGFDYVSTAGVEQTGASTYREWWLRAKAQEGDPVV